MITIWSGFPGSGKSLRVAKEILYNIRTLKRNVICCNMNVNPDFAIRHGKRDGKLMFCPTYSMIYNPAPFYDYALKHHEKGKENQTLLVFDEVQDLISPEACKQQKQIYPNYVNDWTTFFSQHRHLGYEIYLITQYDRMIHPSMRYLIEYEYKHRKLRNAGDFGFFLAMIIRLLTGKEVFVQIQYWRGFKERTGSSFYTWSKKYDKLYDSYKKFGDLLAGDSVSVQAHAGNVVNFNEQFEILQEAVVK